jgi:hypothetical protein
MKRTRCSGWTSPAFGFLARPGLVAAALAEGLRAAGFFAGATALAAPALAAVRGALLCDAVVFGDMAILLLEWMSDFLASLHDHATRCL